MKYIDPKDQYVTQELAKKLREKGFNEPCDAFYSPDGCITMINFSEGKLATLALAKKHYGAQYLAPTWDDAVGWVMHNYGFELRVKTIINEKHHYVITDINDSYAQTNGEVTTYNDALTTGLDAILDLI
jgi:hypothetical protein